MSVDLLGFWQPPATVHPPDLHTPLPPNFSYRNPIPPSTTLTPGELLERFDINKRNKFDQTNVSGILLKQAEVYLNHPEHVAAPIGSSGLVGKWPHPDGLPAVPVPVGMVLDGPEAVVEFKNLNPKCPSAGVSLADLCERKKDVLNGAENIVMLGKKDLQFVISWPGYQPQRFTMGIAGHDGGPLTRIDLGRKIAVIYTVFFSDVMTQGVLPSEVGFFNIALHQGDDARPDSLGVQITQLHLLRLRGSNGNWVADIEIV